MPKIYLTRTGNPFKAFIDESKYASNNFFSLQFKDYEKNNIEDLKFILPFLISKISQYFIRTFAAPRIGSTFVETKIFHLLKFRIPRNTTAKTSVKKIVELILILKKNNYDSIFFERLIDAVVYELYFPEEVNAAGADVLKHLTDLPELQDDWSDKKKIEIIENVYKKLSAPTHSVAIAMFKLEMVPEVRIIEGVDK